ncbi:MAG: ABC transporter substrate-binding protein [Erysipelotrichaceae bacterium]|jgi:multiple sugar transport system substrate-binding protein
MKKLFVFLLTVAMILGFAGCKPTEPPFEGETVTIWHTYTDDQKDTLERIAAEFTALHEGEIRVVVQAQEYSGFLNKVYESVANGVGPDIIFNYASTAATYVGSTEEETLVVDFDKYLSQDFSKLVAPGIYAEMTDFTDGKLHVLPMVTTGPVYFYNEKIFEQYGVEVPKTWKEVFITSKTIWDKSGHTVVGFAVDSLTDLFTTIIMQHDLGYYNEDKTSVLFCNEKLGFVLQQFKDGVNEGYFQLSPQSGDYNSSDMNALTLASYVGSIAGLPYLEYEGIAAIPLPREMDYGMGVVDWAPAWNRGVIVFKSNEAQEAAAVKFAEYFLNEENNAAWAKTMNAFSPYFATQNNPDYQAIVADNLALTALAGQINYSGVLPNTKGAAAIRTALEELIKTTAAGTVSIEEGLKICKAACEAALAE